MKKIEKLTPEQESLMSVYRDLWLQIGLSSGETNKEKAEEAVRKAYSCAGLKPPEIFFWMLSPLHNAVLYSILKNNNLDKSVLASVRDSVRDSVWASVRDSCYGSMDSGWLSFYSYMHEQLKLDCSKLNGLWECAQWCDWFIPFKDICIISQKAKWIKTKANSRGVQVIHAEGEPAIYYCDDFKIYAYEGVRLPEKYGSLHPRNWDPKWIDEETNADIRTALLKGIGYDRWIQATGGAIIHEEEIHNLPYTLIQRQDPSIGIMKFLKMKNPSVPGVFHVEPVAPHAWIETCDDALRWRQLGDLAKDKSVKINYQFIK